MVYEDLKIQGTVREVGPVTLVERLKDQRLVSPDQVSITRLVIDQGKRGSTSIEVFGAVPETYVGKSVDLIQSYYNLPRQRLIVQELYVDGRREINTPVVFRL